MVPQMTQDLELKKKKKMSRSPLSWVMVALGTPTGFLRARAQVFKGVPRTFISMVERTWIDFPSDEDPFSWFFQKHQRWEILPRHLPLCLSSYISGYFWAYFLGCWVSSLKQKEEEWFPLEWLWKADHVKFQQAHVSLQKGNMCP